MKQTLKDGLAFAAFVATVSIVISLYGSNEAAAQSSGKKTETPVIVVWVYDYARIPKHTMARAEREVQKVLGAAAVRFEWGRMPHLGQGSQGSSGVPGAHVRRGAGFDNS